jgi:hypothetical protein
MGWIIAIAAAVFVAIWLMSAVLKAQQEAARPPARPGGGQRTTSSDQIDRFLQEIDRLRRREEQKAEAERRPTPSRPARPTPSVTPVGTRPRPASPRGFSPPPPTRRGDDDVPVVEVVSAAEAKAAETDSRFNQRATTQPKAAPPGPVATAAEARRPHAAATPRIAGTTVAALRPLLRSPQALPLLVVMHEILGPPRCRRPHRPDHAPPATIFRPEPS